jgi:uncharacterized membrane protein YbhN (UPF0104 family)
VKLLITVVFIIILVFKYNLTTVFAQMIDLSFQGMILTLAVYFVTIIISVIKWRILYPCVKLMRFFEVVMIGHFFTIVLPGQLFGEASKIIYLSNEASEYKVPGQVERLSASVIVDKITGLIGLIVIGIVGVAFSARGVQVQYILSAFMATLVGLFFLLVCLRFRWCLALVDYLSFFCETKLPGIKRAIVSLQCVVEAWRLYLNSPVKLVVSILMGVFKQATIVIMHVVLCRYLEIPVSFFDLSWICAIQAIIALLPVTVAGIGLREGGYVGTLGLLGIPATSSLALSLSIFSLQIIGALIGGVFVMKNAVFSALRS